jgi:hypothetical protein
MEEDILGRNQRLIIIGSRAKDQIQMFCGTPHLTVLIRNHQPAKIDMEKAHEIGHKGISSTLHRSRQHIWIIEGKRLIESVRMSCMDFRLKMKKCMEQRMGLFQITGQTQSQYSSH